MEGRVGVGERSSVHRMKGYVNGNGIGFVAAVGVGISVAVLVAAAVEGR